VNWIVKADDTQYEMRIYQEELILPKQSFGITETNPTDGGLVTSDPSLIGWHEYYVAVFKKNKKRLYVDDPKIIIGTGRSPRILEERVDSLRNDCASVLDALNKDSELKEEQKHKAIRQADEVCEAVEKLQKLLSQK
jgi:hypothetical protein